MYVKEVTNLTRYGTDELIVLLNAGFAHGARTIPKYVGNGVLLYVTYGKTKLRRTTAWSPCSYTMARFEWANATRQHDGYLRLFLVPPEFLWATPLNAFHGGGWGTHVPPEGVDAILRESVTFMSFRRGGNTDEAPPGFEQFLLPIAETDPENEAERRRFRLLAAQDRVEQNTKQMEKLENRLTKLYADVERARKGTETAKADLARLMAKLNEE